MNNPASTHDCSTCTESRSSAIVIVGDLIKEVTEGPKKQLDQTLQPFLKAVNAILNSNEDTTADAKRKICLHTASPHLLGEFDKKIDDKLAKLITDNTLFSENFRRYFHDKNHLIFEVKPTQRPLSTLEFNTKIALNKGICDPTQNQMLSFLSREPPAPQHGSLDNPATNKPSSFVKNSEVKVKAAITNDLVPFQECICLQAKPSKEKLRIRGGGRSNRIDEQTDMWWNEQALCQYVSAFCKLPGGGSIFLGVREDVVQGRQTGKFFPHGIVLYASERTAMSQNIQNKIVQEMIWIPEQAPTPEPHVEFHAVQNGAEDEVVVEVVVGHFPGVGFYKKGGPRSFIYTAGGADQTPLTAAEWYKLMSPRKRSREERAQGSSPKKAKTKK